MLSLKTVVIKLPSCNACHLQCIQGKECISAETCPLYHSDLENILISRLLHFCDRALVEPIIRRLHPRPKGRGVAARVLHEGKGELRFLCLPGAFSVSVAASWRSWIRDLRRTFPDAEITIVDGFYYYWPSEAQILEKVIAEGQKTLSDKTPTFVVSFSFGGLLAKAMVGRTSEHDVRAIVSLATEHRGHLPRIAEMRDVRLGVPLDVDLPHYTYGGWFDGVVWPWTAFTDHSVHRFLANGHRAFIRSSSARGKVLADLQKIVARHHG